jgi:membrane protein implicated in regulation of membrane protease activity
MSPTILWLLAGALFIGIEIFGIPGLGFLFAGIAALMVGGAIEFGVLAADGYLQQFLLFFALTSISAALLWKKLKRNTEVNYNNMVGSEATVAQPGLSGGKEGQVKWSGTLMRAKIDPACGRDVLASETAVIIKSVEGNLVYVAPKI